MAGARLDPMKCGVSLSDTRTIWMGAPGRHSLYTIDVPHVDTTVEAEAIQDDLIGSRPRCCREDGRNFPCELGVGGIEGMAALVTRCGFCRPPPLDYCAPDGGLCQLFDDFKGDADRGLDSPPSCCEMVEPLRACASAMSFGELGHPTR